MALLTSEVDRIRYELGYPLLTAAAQPYIGVTAVFDQIVQPYMRAGAATTSTTSVTAATTATPVDIALASPTGFAAGDAAIIDVDARQERATIEAMAGSVITVLCTLAHETSYPVTVEGGETIVREILTAIRTVADELKGTAVVAAGISQADEIRFGEKEAGRRAELQRMRADYRQELADALGVQNLRAMRRGGGQSCALY